MEQKHYQQPAAVPPSAQVKPGMPLPRGEPRTVPQPQKSHLPFPLLPSEKPHCQRDRFPLLLSRLIWRILYQTPILCFLSPQPPINPVSSNQPHAFSNIKQKGKWQILTCTSPTQDVLQEQACKAVGNFRGTLLAERLTKGPLTGGPLLMYYSDPDPLN